MPKNIEIKARVTDPMAIAARAVALGDQQPETLVQRDTFFRCRHGRLKLREQLSGQDELIWYDRPDLMGSKPSTYLRAALGKAGTLREVLAQALGVEHTVEKTRSVVMAGRTRIHLDDVTGLGHFLELEVMLDDGQPEAEGHARAADLLQRLGVTEADLVDCSYADLLARRQGSPG